MKPFPEHPFTATGLSDAFLESQEAVFASENFFPEPETSLPASDEPVGDDLFRRLLRGYWGHADFRGIQLDIIRDITAGRDTLGLMPTGGGKSIAFQIPALALPGLCLVITPLIALMKDQVEHLRNRGIKAAAIYSGLSHDDVLRNLDNCVLGGYKFLYVSPERLGSPIFRTKLSRMQVSFITVDEAHCISQWGYDFRPAYLQIAEIRKLLPQAPVLALTATATKRVVGDIQCRLAFAEPNVHRMSFARPNLRYVVRHTEDKQGELLHILRSVKGSAIVYTRSRQGTKDVARMLKDEGMSALYYHAGLTNLDKDVRQQAWQSGETRIMVATNAFGMGIDKPDVRLVVHLDPPDSVEAYFQEAGRAGRDGLTAYAVLLFCRHDRASMLRRVPETFPEKDFVRRIYDELAYFFQLAVGDGFRVTYEFRLEKFCTTYRHFPTPVSSALSLLEQAGYIVYREEDDATSRVMFLLERDELYRLYRTGPETDKVLQCLLRRYAGLFSDYVFIDEKEMAQLTELSESRVYEVLKALNHQRILHYIPRKRVAHISYSTRRVEGSELVIPKAVYEERKSQYEARIRAMLDYACGEDVCRSRYLLDYFDDTAATDCGRCDVCLSRRETSVSPAALVQQFLQVLSDGRPHHPSELRSDGCSAEVRRAAMEMLMREEGIVARNGRISYQKS